MVVIDREALRAEDGHRVEYVREAPLAEAGELIKLTVWVRGLGTAPSG
jgi:hypothetical protein